MTAHKCKIKIWNNQNTGLQYSLYTNVNNLTYNNSNCLKDMWVLSLKHSWDKNQSFQDYHIILQLKLFRISPSKTTNPPIVETTQTTTRPSKSRNY